MRRTSCSRARRSRWAARSLADSLGVLGAALRWLVLLALAPLPVGRSRMWPTLDLTT